MTQNLEPRTLDSGNRTKDSNSRIQEPIPGLNTQDQELRTKICDQGLAYIFHAVWAGYVQIIFVIWNCSEQISIDINFNTFELIKSVKESVKFYTGLIISFYLIIVS